MSQFTREISLTPVNGAGKLWRNNRQFAWHIGGKGSYLHVVVPAGFVYDLASVPMLARPVVPHTIAPQASCLHDFMYRHNYYWKVDTWDEEGNPVYSQYPLVGDKKLADHEFLEGMLACKVKPWRANLAYQGVNFGGYGAWNDHRKHGRWRPYTTKTNLLKT